MNQLNWKKIQQYYDDNHTWRNVISKFELNNTMLSKAKKQGLFKTIF